MPVPIATPIASASSSSSTSCASASASAHAPSANWLTRSSMRSRGGGNRCSPSNEAGATMREASRALNDSGSRAIPESPASRRSKTRAGSLPSGEIDAHPGDDHAPHGSASSAPGRAVLLGHELVDVAHEIVERDRSTCSRPARLGGTAMPNSSSTANMISISPSESMAKSSSRASPCSNCGSTSKSRAMILRSRSRVVAGAAHGGSNSDRTRLTRLKDHRAAQATPTLRSRLRLAAPSRPERQDRPGRAAPARRRCLAVAGRIDRCANSAAARMRVTKLPAPAAVRIRARSPRAPRARQSAQDRILARSKQLAQQPRRLNGHADAFGDDRVRFARRVADRRRFRRARTAGFPAGSARPTATRLRASRRSSASRTPAHDVLDVREHGLGRTRRLAGHSPRAPASLERVAANAAGEADAAIVGLHHASIAVRKDEQRHQSRRQSGVAKMRLEREQVRRARRVTPLLRRHRPGFPRTMRGDDDARPQIDGACRCADSDPSFATIVQRCRRRRSPMRETVQGCRTAAPTAFARCEQQRIEVFAPHRPTPSPRRIARRGHGGSEHGRAGVQADAADLRAGVRQQGLRDAELAQQRPAGRGNELSAHLSPRERLLLHDRDPPSRLRQEDRGGRARRTTADDERVVVGVRFRSSSQPSFHRRRFASRQSSG